MISRWVYQLVIAISTSECLLTPVQVNIGYGCILDSNDFFLLVLLLNPELIGFKIHRALANLNAPRSWMLARWKASRGRNRLIGFWVKWWYGVWNLGQPLKVQGKRMRFGKVITDVVLKSTTDAGSSQMQFNGKNLKVHRMMMRARLISSQWKRIVG